MDTLLTWVGTRDPEWINTRTRKQEAGPILSLLRARRFDDVQFLVDVDNKDMGQRSAAVVRQLRRVAPDTRVRQRPVRLFSVTDYVEIFRVTNAACQDILADRRPDDQLFVYLSPGTPQMQTVWVLLVQSGLLPARMLDATPPDQHLGDRPYWREVDLTLQDFPQVVDPGEYARHIGVLQARNANLEAANRALHDKLTTLQDEAHTTNGAIDVIPDDFNLDLYLVARERIWYERALVECGGNAAEAARRLRVHPHTFRARAEALGLRPRRARPRP